jgi:hypothetical protein
MSQAVSSQAVSPAARPWAGAVSRPLPRPVPIREVLPWLVFAGLLCLLAVYFVGAEEGATSLIRGMYVHEFVHDGRHLLGFPCH